MNIDEKIVDYIAKLSRLSLTEDEKKVIVPQLKDIVDYIEKLGELNVDDIEPMDHILDLKNVYRDDLPGLSFPREEILQNAPLTDGAFFQVPKII